MAMVAIRPDVHPAGWYTLDEGAALLGIGKTTLLRYVNTGVLRCGEYKRRRYGHRPIVVQGAALVRLWGSFDL